MADYLINFDTWDQAGTISVGSSITYNEYTPDLDGTNLYVGCVATATSQVLYYWGSMQAAYGMSLTVSSLELNGSDYFFLYGNYSTPIYGSSYSTYGFLPFSEVNEKLQDMQYDFDPDEIAALSFAVGVKVHSNYEDLSYGTGATLESAKNFLVDSGFEASYIDEYDWYYYVDGEDLVTSSTFDLHAELVDDITQGMIVLAGIYDDYGGGHAIVIDGYDEGNDLFHFNMGWGNGYNVWNPLTDLPYDFVYMSALVYNIAPSDFEGWGDHVPPSVPTDLVDEVAGDDVSLDWSDSTDEFSGVSRYLVQYSTSSLFLSVVSRIVTVSELAIYNLNEGTYYWRVKAEDGAGNGSDWSVADSFVISLGDSVAPSVPTGLTDSVDEANASLDWSDSTDNDSGVKQYIVEYADNSGFTGATQTTVAVSELDLAGLTDGTYYWRVKAEDNEGNQSDWSIADSFTIDITDTQDPSVPTGLIEQVSGLDVALDWNDSTDDKSGVKEYELAYSTYSNFADSVNIIVTASDADLTGLAVDTYYWRVRAIDNAGNISSWSSSSSFDTYEPDTLAPSVPTALSTVVDEVNVSFDWADSTDAGTGVEGYVLAYSENSILSNPTYLTVTSSDAALEFANNGTWYWSVMAFDYAGNESAWSAVQSFEVMLADETPPSLPSGLTVDVTGDDVSFDWNDSTDSDSGVESYVVEYSQNAGFSGTVLQSTSTSFLSVSDLSDGTWYWRVKAVDASENETAWVEGGSFLVDVTAPSVPVSLAGTVDGSNVLFDWSDSTDNTGGSGLSGYVLQYADNSSFTSATTLSVAASNLDVSALADDFYYWRVKAVDNNGNESAWSSNSTFTVDITPASAPSGLTVDVSGGTAALDWNTSTDNVSGVKEYSVEYSLSADFSSPVSKTALTSMLDITGLTDGTWYWRVRSVDNSGNESAWSVGEEFLVDLTAPDVPIDLVEDITGSNVALDWADSADNAGGSGLKKYIVSYAGNSGFVNAVTRTVASSEINISGLAEGIYYWRVDAEDYFGNVSSWSEVESFIVDITAPTTPDDLSAVVDGSSSGLDWSDSTDNLSGLKEYVVEYSTSPDLSGAVSVTSVSSQLNLNSLTDAVYYWRVKAVDAGGYESEWSTIEYFTIDTTPATTPNGLSAAVVGRDAGLDWLNSSDNLSGVKEYIVEYAVNAGFTGSSILNVDASEVVLSDLADAYYYWRVKSVDNSGNESAWSATGSFLVDITPASVPEDLAAVIDNDSASLDWSDSVDNLTGIMNYVIEFADNSDFSGASTLTSDSSDLDMTDLADATYYWRVKSVDNNWNESAWSAVDSFIIDSTAPTLPSGLSEKISGGDIILNWGDSSDAGSGVKEYMLEYADNSDFTGAVSETVYDSETSLWDLPYGFYYWHVKAVDNYGNTTGWSETEYFNTGDTVGNYFAFANSINVDDGYSYKEYVGLADGYDYYNFELTEGAGTFDIELTQMYSKVKVSLYELLESGALRKIESTNSQYDNRAGEWTAVFDNVMLDNGNYYIEIISGDKGGGRYNTEYVIDITSDFFPDATDNNCTEDATVITPDAGLSGFVGFGDACDYYQFEVAELTTYDFDLTGTDKNAKLTVYQWNEDKGKLKKVKATKLKFGEAHLDNLNLDAGLYYVEVLSADKGRGKKNTEYELDITLA